MTKYMIAGYGKYRYVKKISSSKAKQLEEQGKEVYDSYEQANREKERLKK